MYYIVLRVYWLCYASGCWSSRRQAYWNFSSFFRERIWLFFKKEKVHHKFTDCCWLKLDVFRCFDWFSKQCSSWCGVGVDWWCGEGVLRGLFALSLVFLFTATSHSFVLNFNPSWSSALRIKIYEFSLFLSSTPHFSTKL